MVSTSSHAVAQRRLAWAAAVSALSVLAIAATGAHGRASRSYFTPPPELKGQRVLSVKGAAEAVVIWRNEGIRGRELVVLTGRWSRPGAARPHPRTLGEMEARRSESAFETLDDSGALFTAASAGIARRMEVVMPPKVFEERRAEVSDRRGFQPHAEAYSLPHEGYARRFSTPAGFTPASGRALILIEPSWFTDETPADPLGWLSAMGISGDLSIISLEDDAASKESLAAAERYAAAVGAVRAEFTP